MKNISSKGNESSPQTNLTAMTSPQMTTVESFVIPMFAAFLISCLCNFCLTLIYVLGGHSKTCKFRRKTSSVDVILGFISLTCSARTMTKSLVYVALFLSGGWVFGDAFCQLQSYVDVLCRHLFFWLMALFSFERYTKHLMPHDHVITFSPLSVKVMIPGTFLLISAQVSSPLYGWGQYGYVPEYGVCDLLLSSAHCCSYMTYTWIVLIFPPVCVLGFCLGKLIRRSKAYFSHDDNIYMRGLLREKSRILEEDKEIKTIVLSGLLSVVLILPTWVLAIFESCEVVSKIYSGFILVGYLLEVLSGLILPVVCVLYHSKIRETIMILLRNDRCCPVLRSSNSREQTVATVL
ncbi:uncharacterized protein LOC143245192 [Tachypleus tridentatus]|uniref:uncharacterized protein LOC143245192 n=1 Tax=Tachypleus tridentatus TaxID=6853 RepID=UPI003FD1921A